MQRNLDYSREIELRKQQTYNYESGGNSAGNISSGNIYQQYLGGGNTSADNIYPSSAQNIYKQYLSPKSKQNEKESILSQKESAVPLLSQDNTINMMTENSSSGGHASAGGHESAKGRASA